MKFLDKAKQAAEQAAARAKEGVEDVQARKDLHLAYVDLGKKTVELIDAGAVAHADLDPLAARVRELKARLADDGESDAGEEADAEPRDTSPPAMPT